MKHTTKLLTVLATVIAVFSLTGCPKPVGEIDDEPIEVVHEHSWGEGEITTKPTCTNKGVRTFTCECGAKRTEEVAPLGHDFQGGYCERCGEYEFEDGYKFTLLVFEDNEKFKKFYGVDEYTAKALPYKECYFSFADENEEIDLTVLIQLKSVYKDYKVIKYYDGRNTRKYNSELKELKKLGVGSKIKSILIAPITEIE